MIEFIGLVLIGVFLLFFVLPIVVGIGMAILGIVGVPLAALWRFFHPG